MVMTLHDHGHGHSHSGGSTDQSSLSRHSHGGPHEHSHSEGAGSHEHGVDQHTQREAQSQNITVRAALIHVIGDLVQSLGVFVAAMIIYFKVTDEFFDNNNCFVG